MRLKVGQSYQARNGEQVKIDGVLNGCFQGEIAGYHGDWLENGQAYFPPGHAKEVEADEMTLICVWGEEPVEPETRVSRETAQVISKGLEGIVARFNEEFSLWMETTGCRANFEWRYDGQEIKQLAIKDIDAMIYRKPVPNWQKKEGT